jgi:PAS domain S-box-containing protein
MRFPKIVLAIAGLFIAGTLLLSQFLVRYEEKRNIRDIQDRGIYLVSLISLYPITDFTPTKRAFFLRTLTEYTSNQGFLYLFVHDTAGRVLVSLSPQDMRSLIPADIQTNAIYSTALINQNFKVNNQKSTIYEFSKPIFENGQKTGTVRLGFKLPETSMYSLDRMSVLAMLAFFIFSAVIFVYYGITMALKPLSNRNLDLLRLNANDPSIRPEAKKGYNLVPMIEDLERSLRLMHEKVNEVRSTNIELNSKLGVMSYEKHQIVRIIDTINFGIVIMDSQNHIWNMNEYMLKLLGKERENVMDRPLTEAIEQQDIVAFIHEQETGENRGTMNYMETSFPDRAPGDIYQITLSYFTEKDKTPIGKVLSVRNVTSAKSAQKAQQEFIAHVAHELMTPLTNIISYSEMLMDNEVENPEMQKDFYNTINQEAGRLSDLIKNLLKVSVMEMGSLTVNKGLLRTDWLVDGCLSAIEASARDKRIAIEKNLPDVFPSIIADKELLKAAVINILGNAVKYTPEDGRIVFSIAEQGDHVVLDIVDTGYGIAPEDLPHIFSKFYRANNPQVYAQTGSGLGLAIASEIVQLHGGEINVQSTLGEGSRFTIRMPREEYVIGKQ